MAFLFSAPSLASTGPDTLVATPRPSSSVLYLPAGAHAAGANGANWRTDVEVHNPGSSTASFTVQLLKSDADNSSPASRSYTLAAGRSRRFADVLVSEFGFEGAAALRISVTSGMLAMTSRTYNLLGANPWNLPTGASFGLFEPGIVETDALSYGQEGRLIQLTQQPSSSLDGFRTNVGIVNTTASPIDVTAEFYRSDGTYLGKKERNDTNLPAYGFRQLNEVLGTWGTVTDGYAIVKTTTVGGGLIAFATVIDNHNSGDPIFIPAAKVSGSSATPTYLPASAHAGGMNGSNWRTDMEVHNPGTTAVTYTIALLKQSTDNGGSVPTRTFSLGPQQSVRYADVLSTVFSTDGAAALRVTPQSGNLLVNSRTYNLIGTNSVGLPEGASFGQFVPGLAESEAIGPGEEGRIIQLTHRDASTLADFRSNVGFVNTTASPIDLRIDLMGADGGLLATIQDDRTHLRPYESKQINGIFGEATSWLQDGYVIVQSMTSDGRFFAFATVIDNHVTGDPVFVPAVKMARSSLPPGPDEPLTLAEAAPTIAQTVASVIVGALEGGSASASNAPVMSRTLYAQSAFTGSCPNGGNVRLGGVVSSGLRYMLTQASATFVGCGFIKSGRAATMNGALALNGVWCPGQSSCNGPTYEKTSVSATGTLDMPGIGSVPLDGVIGPGEYTMTLGCAGCVFTGTPDTPPPPNPNTCPATVTPASFPASASGGAFAVNVAVGSTCPWTAASNSGFITVTGGASGRGPGTVSFSVAANTGAARTGSLSIAGQTVTVTQAGSSCSYSINPTSQSFGSSGGSGSVAVATGNGCAWTATSNDSWITVVSGSSGNGPGTVNYSVAVNTTTAQRSGTITIAGQSVTVNQAAGATPPPAAHEIYKGTETVNVTVTTTAPSGCVPNPYMVTTTSPPISVELDVNGSLLVSGAFSGTLVQGSSTVTVQTPTLTCTVAGTSFTSPGSTTTSPVAGTSGAVSGSSNGSTVSFNIPDANVAGCTVSSLRGNITVVAGIVRLDIPQNVTCSTAGTLASGTVHYLLTRQ